MLRIMNEWKRGVIENGRIIREEIIERNQKLHLRQS
jgi:hypothetical protein